MRERNSDSPNESSSRALEQAVDRFEAAWQAGRRPSIREFCPPGSSASASVVAELVLIEFEYRYRAGERPHVEDYLLQYPELREDDRAVIGLVAAEARWQAQFGPTAKSEQHSTEVGNGLGFAPLAPCADENSETSSAVPPGPEADSRQGEPSSFHSTSPFATNAPGETPGYIPGSGIVLAGRFRLLDCLGEGGFGTVYRAVDRQLDRVVAVKIPAGGALGSKEERDRLLREARSAAQLRHPNIVPVYGIFQEERPPFIVSAFVAGLTLSALLEEQTFDPRAAAEIVAALAEGLQFAHDHNVVHRDVKPSNIILESPGFPVLMDFGLAKREGVDISLTRDGQMVGTPAYMSPEQAAGDVSRVDARSDIYSLGVVLYELVTGERPFRGNIRMIVHQVLNEEPRSPASLNDRVPRDLATICLKCLQKAPSSRYQTARDLAEDLRRFLRHEPIHARPVSLLEREWRRVRRRPWTSGLIAAVVCLTITVAVVSTIAALRIDSARRHSEASALESLDRLEQLYLGNGNASVDGNDPLGACPWFLKAWQLRKADSSRDAVYRARLVSAMRQAPSLIRFWSHPGSGVDVKFSPDGRQLAIASSDRIVMLCDLSLPAKRPAILKHPASVLQCGFDSAAEHLVTVSIDGSVRVWQTRDGDHEPIVLAHPLPTTWAAFSPDSQQIATACTDGVVRFWDVATGERSSVTLRHKASVRHLAFSPDGELVATASADKTARVWLVQTGESIGTPLVHGGPVNRVGFSPDGRRVFTASSDATARIWDSASGRQQVELQHADPVERILHALGHDWVITSTDHGAVRVWDTTDGRIVRDLPGHVDRVPDMALSPDGRRLATASEDRTARIWNLESGALEYPLIAQPAAIGAVGFSTDSQRLVTAGSDGTVRLWKLQEPFEWETRVDVIDPVRDVAYSAKQRKLLITAAGGDSRLCSVDRKDHRNLPLAGLAGVRASALSSQGNLLATADSDNRVQLWDLSTSQAIGSSEQFERPINGLHFSPDGRRLLIATTRGKAWIWDLKASKGMLSIEDQSPFLAVGLGENAVYTVGGGSTIKIWDAASCKLRSEIRTDSNRNEHYFFSPKFKHFVTGGRYGDAHIWHMSTGQHQPLSGSRTVLHASFSPDESMVATGSTEDIAELWDVATAERLAGPLVHRRNVTYCTFDAQGDLVATASDDRTARVWNAHSGVPVSPYLPHEEGVVFMAFQSDQDCLLTVSADGAVRAWDLGDRAVPSSQLIRLAHVVTGREIDTGGSMVPISRHVLEQEWTKYQRELGAASGSAK